MVEDTREDYNHSHFVMDSVVKQLEPREGRSRQPPENIQAISSVHDEGQDDGKAIKEITDER